MRETGPVRLLNVCNRCALAARTLQNLDDMRLQGNIVSVAGLSVAVAGLGRHLNMGDRITLASPDARCLTAEVVGFSSSFAHAAVFVPVEGLGPGGIALTQSRSRSGMLAVSDGWIGRVVSPLGQPLDRFGPLSSGMTPRRVRSPVAAAMTRARLGARLDLGIRVLNIFTTCRAGQRMGLFAGAGVGKSSLLAMLARNTACDIIVVALVGERGREVREFVEDILGLEGLSRSIVIVATSDTPPIFRREAAYAAMTIAEHFRDVGHNVLLLMDSVTRFCFALRDIALAAGEPPSTRGYPPSVFTELPRLLERAGPGINATETTGHITAFFTVLVEGDDHSEPIADGVRGFLDGHVVLDRAIAERVRYPAVDVLRSLSRSTPDCNTESETELIRRSRRILATYNEIADLIKLGAYRPGSDQTADDAIARVPRIEAVLAQSRDERSDIVASFKLLETAVR